ncbi:unnamed protein product [Effrenium voratum]|nr:unnamed protein product [Effrenium voratum]CAJ1417913.1 unnamed protein product [Effrenium voratum]
MEQGRAPGPAPGRFARLVGPLLDGAQRPDAQEAAKVITSLGRAQRWQEALASFLPWQASAKSIVWNSVISACTNHRTGWQVGLALLDLLERDSNCKANVVSYNLVLGALMKCSEMGVAVNLLRDFPSRQILPDTCSFNTVMGTLAKQPPRCDLVLSILEECGRGPGLDTQSFNIAVAACGRANRWQKAIDFLEVMRSARSQPDLYSYTSAISACKEAAAWKAAELLEEMKGAKLQPGIVTYGAVISARASDGDWKAALALLNEAKDSSLEVTTIACNSVIDACEKGAQWSLALCLLDEMSDERIPRSTSSFNSALRACGACRRWQRSLALLGAMGAQSCRPDMVSFNGAIAACVKGLAWAQAITISQTIGTSGLEPDDVTWTCLLSAYGAGQQWRAALELHERLGRWKAPSTIVTNALLGALEGAGRWLEALHLLSRARGANSASYSAVISACGRSSCWQWAVWLLAELRQRGLSKEDTAGRRWAVAYRAAVQACRPSGRWQEALLVLGAMRLEGKGADRPGARCSHHEREIVSRNVPLGQ